MKKKKNAVLSLLLGVLMIFLMVSPVSQRTATIVWSETFDTPGDWVLHGFDLIDGFEWSPVFAPTIASGVLQMPNTQIGWNISLASHPSTTAYGTWSFDWHINAGVNHNAYDIVFFIANNFYPDDQSGDPKAERTTGYGLALKSNHTGYSGFAAHSVTLGEWILQSDSFFQVGAYQFSGALEGLYHIDITRNTTGGITVYFDSNPVIEATDNTTTTSEKFVFGSYFGDTAFDNLTVSNTVDVHPPPPPSTSEYPHLFMLFGIISVVIILRRKRRE